MKDFLKKIIDYFNFSSQINTDSRISSLKKDAKEYNLDLSIFQDQEDLIQNTSDENSKHKLKIKLKKDIENYILDSSEYQTSKVW